MLQWYIAFLWHIISLAVVYFSLVSGVICVIQFHLTSWFIKLDSRYFNALFLCSEWRKLAQTKFNYENIWTSLADGFRLTFGFFTRDFQTNLTACCPRDPHWSVCLAPAVLIPPYNSYRWLEHIGTFGNVRRTKLQTKSTKKTNLETNRMKSLFDLHWQFVQKKNKVWKQQKLKWSSYL